MPAWEHSGGNYHAAVAVGFDWSYYHIFAAVESGLRHVHLTTDVAVTLVVFGWATSLAL